MTRKSFFIGLICCCIVILIGISLGLTHTLKEFLGLEPGVVLSISPLSPYIEKVTAGSNSKIYFKITARNQDGSPKKYASVKNLAKGPGKVVPETQIMDKYGEALFYYQADAENITPHTKTTQIALQSALSSEILSNIYSLEVIPSPIILVHGYREKPYVFDTLQNFLQKNGFNTKTIEYASTEGIEKNSAELYAFIQNYKKELYLKGIVSNDFTLICHSYGGLVSRFYTASSDYLKHPDVNKIIFLSVPHHGTDIATLAENTYKDQTIRELSPQSTLFMLHFPKMINKGLNPDIQVANILGQYDKVVTAESASLDDWKIDTILYNVGTNTRTFDNILKGSILEAPNHHSVLNNQKIFEKIKEILTISLPKPSRISK